MTYSSTAFQATHLWQRVASKLGLTKNITATGGSATTIVDTSISTDYQDYSDFQSNYAFVRYDAGGAGAAPEGEVQLVTNYVASTTTLTVNTYTAAVAAGDKITLVRGSVLPLSDLINICDMSIKELYQVPDVDITITTAANQTEHSVPTGVWWQNIVQLEIQGDKSDANDQRYSIIPRAMWKVVPPASEGGTATLVIPQFTSGYVVRVTFLRPHADLHTYASDISKAINPTLAVAKCALECALWKSDQFKDMIPRLQKEYENALSRYPTTKFIKSMGGMPHWKNRVVDPGIPDPIS